MTPAVLVLGAGSIGARHARNLSAAGAAVSVSDPAGDRAGALRVDGIEPVEPDAAWRRRWDGVVVASPTSLHVDHALQALDVADRVLVEKPIGTTAAAAAVLATDEMADRIAVAYNLRFHRPLRRLAELVHDGEVGAVRSARLWFGSWLPSWRPAVDYRSTYSARRSQGGGVLLDAIHELDLVVWLLGGDLSISGAVVDRCGSLDIDVEDTAVALLRGSGGIPVSVSLDYLSRRYRRGVEIVGDIATVRLDWARRVIELEDANGVDVEVADDDVARSYEDQAAAFLSWITGGTPLPVDGPTGLRSLELADAIRAAA